MRTFCCCAAILFSVGALVTAQEQAGKSQPSRRVVHWATDIQPALESVICVSLADQNGKKVFEAFIAESTECPGPLPSDPLLAQVAKLLAGRRMLIRAGAGNPSKAFEGIPQDAAHQHVAQGKYQTMVLGDPETRRRLMPRIHQLLVSSGAECPDCPGPTQWPTARSVSRAELMPYVLAYLWPTKVEPDGHVTMQICAGTNGIREMQTPDPLLVEAGFEVAFGNWNAVAAAMRQAKVAASSAEGKARDPEVRVRYVRKYLAEALPKDPKFVEALQPAINNLQEIGLACRDCS